MATFSNLLFDTTGTYTLSVSDGSLTAATTATITVSPGAASQLVVTQTPATGTAGQALGTALKVAVEDAFGNTIASNASTISVTVASGPGSLASGSTTAIAATSGVATFSNLIFNTAGNYTLTVSDGSLTAATTGSVTVSPAAASKLVITQTPGGGTAGQALGTALQIAVADAFGNVVTSNSSTLAVTVANGPAGFASGSTTSIAAASGIATFSNLIFNTAGSYALSVSDGSLTGASSGSIPVSPAAATTLSIVQTPSTGAMNQALSPSLQVAIKDQFGNVVTGNSSSVTVALASGPGTFASGSTTSVTAVNGVATFSNLMLNATGTYTLSVSDGSLTGATSGNVTISSSSTASQLAITQSPTAGTAGQAMGTALSVAVENASGSTVTSNTSTVTVTVLSGPGGFASGSTTSVTAVNGVASFSNLILNTAGIYTLSVSDGSLTGATTSAITISPAAASKLALTQTPTTGTAGQALGTSLTVAIEDAFGNVLTGNSSSVTVALASGPAGFASGSTTSAAAVNGVATFSKLIFNTAGTYTLSVSGALLSGATSGSFTVSAAAASKLLVNQAPSAGVAGQALSPSLTVSVEDAFGNVVTGNSSTVTVSSAGPAQLASNSTASVAAVNGIATFSRALPRRDRLVYAQRQRWLAHGRHHGQLHRKLGRGEQALRLKRSGLEHGRTDAEPGRDRRRSGRLRQRNHQQHGNGHTLRGQRAGHFRERQHTVGRRSQWRRHVQQVDPGYGRQLYAERECRVTFERHVDCDHDQRRCGEQVGRLADARDGDRRGRAQSGRDRRHPGRVRQHGEFEHVERDARPEHGTGEVCQRQHPVGGCRQRRGHVQQPAPRHGRQLRPEGHQRLVDGCHFERHYRGRRGRYQDGDHSKFPRPAQPARP